MGMFSGPGGLKYSFELGDPAASDGIRTLVSKDPESWELELAPEFTRRIDLVRSVETPPASKSEAPPESLVTAAWGQGTKANDGSTDLPGVLLAYQPRAQPAGLRVRFGVPPGSSAPSAGKGAGTTSSAAGARAPATPKRSRRDSDKEGKDSSKSKKKRAKKERGQ